MNMRNIYWKNFRSSYKDYLYFILSGIISISAFLELSFILELVNYIKDNQRLVNFVEYYEFIKNIRIIFIVLSIGLLVYNFKNYTDKRFEDYSIFTILGGKVSLLEKIITMEIITIYFISIIIGSLISVVIMFLLIYMTNIDITPILYEINILSLFKIYILYFIIFLLCIFYSIYTINSKDSFELLEKSKKSGYKNKKSNFIAGLVGILLLIFSVYFLVNFYNRDGYEQEGFFILFGCILVYGIGVYMTIFNFESLSYEFFLKDEKCRYKNLLKYNGFFYRISKNSMVVFIYFLVTSLIFLFGSAEVVNQLDINYEDMYPFNIVVTSKSEKKLNEVLSIDSIDKRIVETKYINWGRTDDHTTPGYEANGFLININDIGMLTDKNYEIRKGQINFSEQIFEDLGYPALDGYSEILISDKKDFLKRYKIFKRERKYILGSFDNYLGCPFISTDRDTFYEIPGEKIYIGTFNFSSNVKDEDKSIYIENLRKICKDEGLELYETESLIVENKNLNFFRALSFVFIVLILSSIKNLIVYINSMSDLEYLKKKYFILNVCGLDSKSFKKYFNREYILSFIIPTLLSFILMEIIFYLVSIDHKDMSILLYFNCIVCVLILIDFIFYKAIINTAKRKLR